MKQEIWLWMGIAKQMDDWTIIMKNACLWASISTGY
jgi:hypothetical protein